MRRMQKAWALGLLGCSILACTGRSPAAMGSGGTSGEAVQESSSSSGPEGSSTGTRGSSSSSTGRVLEPDPCPSRTLAEPSPFSFVFVEVDRDGPEPFPTAGPHTWTCTATGLLDEAESTGFGVELECVDVDSDEAWTHQLFFADDVARPLLEPLIGAEDLRLEYDASFGGFGVPPPRYSLRDAQDELLIWTHSFAQACTPSGDGEENCNLAEHPLVGGFADPAPFLALTLVGDACGLRPSADGDFLPSHTPPPPEREPPLVHRHAVAFDDDAATLVHDGRSARLVRDGQAFDAFVSSAHITPTESGAQVSNASILILRVQ